VSGFFHIVSLGYRCRTSHRLREHFGHSTAFPFDWWITPIEGLIRFLDDWDVDRLYRPDQLRVHHKLFQKAWVENREYGFRLVHEFTRNRWRLATRQFLDEAPQVKARTAHLMAKFDELDSKRRRVLFVRNVSLREEGDAAGCEALRQAVLRRVPRADPEFLLISNSGMAAEGWIPLKVDDSLKEPWSGDPAAWNTPLSTLGFRLHRPGIPQPPRPTQEIPEGLLQPPGWSRLLPRPGFFSSLIRREA